VLEQPDATVFLDPGLELEVDRFGNLLIARAGELQAGRTPANT
jgi:hypothetical protein